LEWKNQNKTNVLLMNCKCIFNTFCLEYTIPIY